MAGRAAGSVAPGSWELINIGTLTNAQPIAAGEVWSVEVKGLPVPDSR
jgi:hypothetical protein